jgi:hypothetical protein
MRAGLFRVNTANRTENEALNPFAVILFTIWQPLTIFPKKTKKNPHAEAQRTQRCGRSFLIPHKLDSFSCFLIKKSRKERSGLLITADPLRLCYLCVRIFEGKLKI